MHLLMHRHASLVCRGFTAAMACPGETIMKKILIVDDQADIRRLLRLTLPKHYEIFEAANASDAHELILRERPDAVVLDVMMPGEMDGYELCRKIKQERSLADIHVVLVTARGQEADRQLGSAAGADGYFVKPFSPLALVRHLELVLAAAS
jgi:two-component system phosphate regulon response regulator PhoB